MFDEVRETEPSNATILVPTPSMSIESRLGRRTGCEDYLERTRAIELRRLGAAADQEEQEVARRKARLEAKPPLLEGASVIAAAPATTTAGTKG
jgi:hypothetical protein